MKNVRKLTEGAILLAAFTVLLLMTIYVPLIGAFLNLALPIPFMLFAAKNDWKGISIFVIASLLILVITGAIVTFPLIIAYLLIGTVMGYLIQKNKSRTTILIAGSLVFLISLVFFYVISVAFFHMNIIGEMNTMMQDSLSQSADLLKSLGQQQNEQTLKKLEQSLDLMKTLIPSLFVLISIMTVFVIQLVSFPIIKRFGVKVEKWKPFHEISLPKSLLWYYLGAILATLLFHPQTGTYWSAVLINLTFIMQMFMTFQGLTFLFYFFHQKGVSKSLPITILVFSFVIPSALYIVGILGIIDLGFGLRTRSEKKNND